MSDAIHHLQVLHNNPFIFASTFIAFFKEIGEKERTLLLGYFVLPLTLHKPSRAFLQNANRRSSLRSMLKDRSRIHGLDERVARYREMTHITIQYLLDVGGISIYGHLSLSVGNQQFIDSTSPEGLVKAACRLGNLFRPYDVPMVYRMLGVMAL